MPEPKATDAPPERAAHVVHARTMAALTGACERLDAAVDRVEAALDARPRRRPADDAGMTGQTAADAAARLEATAGRLRGLLDA